MFASQLLYEWRSAQAKVASVHRWCVQVRGKSDLHRQLDAELENPMRSTPGE